MSNLSRKFSSTGCDLQFSRLELVCWPSRLDLFQAYFPDVIRICALLARRPSVGILIPVLLGLPPQVTYALLKALYAKGCIRSVGEAVAPELAALPEVESGQDFEHSTPMALFLHKVWHRLTQTSTLWGAEGILPVVHEAPRAQPAAVVVKSARCAA